MIGTPRAEMHGAGAIRSRSRDHAAYTLGVPVRLYVHLTWTTLQRQPLINHGVADFLRRFLPREAKRHGARLLASGIVADHVHGSATSSCHEHPSAYPGTEGCERATRQSGRAHAAGASAMG